MASDVTAVHLFLFAEMLLEEENTWLVLSPSALAKYSQAQKWSTAIFELSFHILENIAHYWHNTWFSQNVYASVS